MAPSWTGGDFFNIIFHWTRSQTQWYKWIFKKDFHDVFFSEVTLSHSNFLKFRRTIFVLEKNLLAKSKVRQFCVLSLLGWIGQINDWIHLNYIFNWSNWQNFLDISIFHSLCSHQKMDGMPFIVCILVYTYNQPMM